MSQTVPSNPNTQDLDAQIAGDAEGQLRTTGASGEPAAGAAGEPAELPGFGLMPPQLNSMEMLEEPKLVFRGQADAARAQRLQAKQMSYRQGGRWEKLPLRSKVVAIAAVLGILPASALGMIDYGLQNEALTGRLETAAELSASAMNDQLSLFMRERFGDIQVMAREELFTDGDRRGSATVQQRQEVLDRFVDSYSIYNSVAVFDLNGEPLGNSGGETIGNHSDRSYFQAALAQDGPVISQPLISESSGIFSVYLAAPIKDRATGQTVGVVRARIPVQEMEALLQATAQQESAKQGGAVEYRLYNQSNELFADSIASLEALQPAGPAIANRLPLEKGEAGKNSRGQATGSSQDASRSFGFTTLGQAVGYAPFTQWSDRFRADLPELGWKTVVTIDSQVLASERQRLLQGLIFQALISGGLLALVAGLLATRAVRPLLQAVDAVKRIGRGDLAARLPVKGEDELAILADNLNQMADQLQRFNAQRDAMAQRASWLTNLAIDADGLSPEELDQRLAQAVHQAREFLGVDRVVVYSLERGLEGGDRLGVAQESVGEDWPSAASLDLGQMSLEPEFLRSFQQGEPVAISAVSQADLPDGYATLLQELAVQSEVVVPLVEHRQMTGLLVAQTCGQEKDWDEGDINFIQQIAAQWAIVQQIQQVEAARGQAELNVQQEKQRIEELQRRVMQLLMEVDPVSRGDLTIRAKVTEDEIGTVADSYNATIESLRRIVSQVQETVLQVVMTASGSGEAVQNLASGASRQNLEIGEALGSIEQMVNSIRQVSTNAAQAEMAVQKAADTVRQGDDAMDKTVEGIFAIRETVGEAAKKVKRLGESSQKISKVVNLISSFAEQTNLLALNASIEAAHAGEEGRGFAVVADEVRSLARQSAQATAEIEALVAEIQSETNQVSAAMESGTAQVVVGTQMVEVARQNLTQIAQVSEEISVLVAGIAQATHQQTAASEQVSMAMGDVAGIANQTSSSADQVSASLEALVMVAQSLEASVGQFKLQ